MLMRFLSLGLAALIGGLGTWYFVAPDHPGTAPTQSEKKILYWWDPMMPDYKSDKPGKSPMGMDMVPVYEGEQSETPAETPGSVTLAPGTVQRLGVKTEAAKTQALAPVIRTFGSVTYDETRTTQIHVRAPGWVEKLHVRSLGARVREGDPLFTFFSRDIAIAALEYAQARRHRDPLMIAAIESKLKALGVNAADIQRLTVQTGERPAITFRAPRSGIVVALDAREGAYLEPAADAFVITDTSSVWLIAQVFESDLTGLAQGMTARATLRDGSKTSLTGTVDYIYPELDPMTRTARVRIRFDNPGGILKPDALADVTLIGVAQPKMVTVPKDAIIRTGRDSHVIAAIGDGEFKPLNVTPGATVDGRTEIVAGLHEGTRVVTSPLFLIDSESNLKGAIALLDSSSTDKTGAKQKAPESAYWTTGKITAIDSKTRMLTVAHDPIPALNWPAMTMAFTVAPDIDIASLKTGQTIRFNIREDKAGYVITAIKAAAESPR